MAVLKAAVVGTGGAARLHAAAYAANSKTRLVGVVSGEQTRADGLAGEFGCRGYVSLEEMLRVERPDVVSVATLEWDHEAPVLAALAAGAQVLCEKPMADTLAAGERMVAAAERAGRNLAVNFNYRSVPSHRLLREELERGGFGRPALFTAETHAYLWPHMLDLLRYWFGDPLEVTAAMVDDQALRPPVLWDRAERPGRSAKTWRCCITPRSRWRRPSSTRILWRRCRGRCWCRWSRISGRSRCTAAAMRWWWTGRRGQI